MDTKRVQHRKRLGFKRHGKMEIMTHGRYYRRRRHNGLRNAQQSRDQSFVLGLRLVSLAIEYCIYMRGFKRKGKDKNVNRS